MTGTIQADGKVLSDEGNTYHLATKGKQVWILLGLPAGVSYEKREYKLVDLPAIIGRKVSFSTTGSGTGYDYRIIS